MGNLKAYNAISSIKYQRAILRRDYGSKPIVIPSNLLIYASLCWTANFSLNEFLDIDWFKIQLEILWGK